MAVFASRQIVIPPPTLITVTITGSGNETTCYAIINGTKQYSAGTHAVYAGDTITFGVFGMSFGAYIGSVTIDGTEVLSVESGTVETYDWTVPNGISTVEIAMTLQNNNKIITVTTA